jgi:ABC-type multidrug transport system ATPase subunit
MTDIEKGPAEAPPGISVSQAEAEFAELRREISHMSRVSRRKSNRDGAGHHDSVHPDAHATGASSTTADEGDTIDGDDGGFDLETILRDGLNYVGQKHVGVYWDNLVVKGSGGTQQRYIKGFMNTFLEFFGVTALMEAARRRPEATILAGSSGVCRPGEMVLVLGRPGSGCTTWLKAIANQRTTFSGVEGEVLYGAYGAAEFEKRFRGEAVFNDEMDAHIPSLTVEQTLSFALDLRLPARLPEGFPSRGEFKAHVVTTLLRMFNIEHTRHTVVGDHLIRGVSGGEKRRLSIAEMMVTRASVLAWDNSTRGLDSATALDFVKSARVLTNLYRTSTFITLYQASENMFRQFDRVLVLDAGRQVYFGPTAEARDYFRSLGFRDTPRQTTPDFLTACTDRYERAYADGRGPANAPHDAETLAAAWDSCGNAARVRAEMAAYKDALREQDAAPFKAAVKDSKRASSSVYTVGFHLQLWALMKRQFLR